MATQEREVVVVELGEELLGECAGPRPPLGIISVRVCGRKSAQRFGPARDAACHEHPGVSFFPQRGESIEAAKRVCRSCLVRVECLEYALVTEAVGVWGGTSERQRADALRRGLDAATLLASLTKARRPPPPSHPPCVACGGQLARRDTPPYCWGCAGRHAA